MDGMKTWMGKQGYMDGVADVDLSWGDGNGWGGECGILFEIKGYVQ